MHISWVSVHTIWCVCLSLALHNHHHIEWCLIIILTIRHNNVSKRGKKSLGGSLRFCCKFMLEMDIWILMIWYSCILCSSVFQPEKGSTMMIDCLLSSHGWWYKHDVDVPSEHGVPGHQIERQADESDVSFRSSEKYYMKGSRIGRETEGFWTVLRVSWWAGNHDHVWWS